MEEKEAEERGPVENEPAVSKIAEMDCRSRRQYRKRDPLADYNKPPVPKSTSAAENQADGPSDKPKKRRDPLADYNRPPVPKSPSAAENQVDGPSDKPKKRRDPLTDYNKPPVPKSSVAEIKRTRPNPLTKPKPTTAGEKNHQAGSSSGPASSKKTTTTTVGEKVRVGRPSAAGAKSKRTEALNSTATSSSCQSTEDNYQSPSCGGETTFLCFFCSKTKEVQERYPGRLNTCTKCHAYYIAQVASR